MRLSVLRVCAMAIAALVIACAPHGSAAQSESRAESDADLKQLPITEKQRRALLSKAYEGSRFPQRDTNHDGRVKFQEWADTDWRSSLIYDADGDGFLSRAEFLTKICPIVTDVNNHTAIRCVRFNAGQFTKLDAQAPHGIISKEEYRVESRGWFSVNDVCKDGFVTESETYVAARTKRCADVEK